MWLLFFFFLLFHSDSNSSMFIVQVDEKDDADLLGWIYALFSSLLLLSARITFNKQFIQGRMKILLLKQRQSSLLGGCFYIFFFG